MSKLLLVVVVAGLLIAPSIAYKRKCDRNRLYNRFNRANNRLLGQFLSQELEKHRYRTFATSSFIALFLGGAIALNSNGDVYDELLQLLNLENREQIKEALSYALDIFTSNGEVKSKLGSLLAADDHITFRKDFKRRFRDLINGETDNIHTSDRVSAAQKFNQWVKGQDPDHEIQDVISPYEIHRDVHGLYFFGFHKFEANWGSPFNPQRMADISFHVNKDKKITLPALVGDGYLMYSENKDLDCQMVEFPQKGHEYSILVLLTNTVGGLPALIETIRQQPDLLTKGYHAMERTYVNATIPLGEVHATTDFKESLIKANFTALFNRKDTDLKHIITTRNNKNIYIAEARHTISIVGNEQVGGNSTTSKSFPVECDQEKRAEVICDHPFLYIVMGECATFMIAGLYFGNT